MDLRRMAFFGVALGLLGGCGSGPHDATLAHLTQELQGKKSILLMCNEPVLGFQVSLNDLNIEKVILSQALLIEQPRQGRSARIEAALGRAGLISSSQTVTVNHTSRTPPNSPTEYTLYQKQGDATTRYLVYDENALGHTDGLCLYSVALRYTDWNDPLVQHLTLN